LSLTGESAQHSWILSSVNVTSTTTLGGVSWPSFTDVNVRVCSHRSRRGRDVFCFLTFVANVIPPSAVVPSRPLCANCDCAEPVYGSLTFGTMTRARHPRCGPRWDFVNLTNRITDRLTLTLTLTTLGSREEKNSILIPGGYRPAERILTGRNVELSDHATRKLI
jgi:hypothetical protein